MMDGGLYPRRLTTARLVNTAASLWLRSGDGPCLAAAGLEVDNESSGGGVGWP